MMSCGHSDEQESLIYSASRTDEGSSSSTEAIPLIGGGKEGVSYTSMKSDSISKATRPMIIGTRVLLVICSAFISASG